MVDYKVWVCLGCEKEWLVPEDNSSFTVRCGCGSSTFLPKAVLDRQAADIAKAEEGIMKKVDEKVASSVGKVRASMKALGEKLSEVTAWTSIHKDEHRRLEEKISAAATASRREAEGG